METDALRRRGVMKACSTTVRAALAPAAAQHGYSLVELLVAFSLGSVVLTFLGGGLLLSEVKVSASIQRNLYSKDAANRAIDLMRREASFSRFIERQTAPSGGVLDNCTASTPIAYIQRNDAIVCYKTVAPSDLPSVYGTAYKGPCVLVRRGPPYKPDGTLDLTATPTVQVLLDGVAKTPSSRACISTTAFTVNLGSLSSGVSRNAEIAITQDSNLSTPFLFSARVPSNPAYDGNDLYDKCTVNSTSGCGLVDEASYHFKPLMNSTSEVITGSTFRENVFYFKYPFSEYTLRENSSSGSCKYSSCYVQRSGSAVRMSNVDALIFADREIRPST